MNAVPEFLPPGRVWLPVKDLPSALQALELLIAHILQCSPFVEEPDCDII